MVAGVAGHRLFLEKAEAGLAAGVAECRLFLGKVEAGLAADADGYRLPRAVWAYAVADPARVLEGGYSPCTYGCLYIMCRRLTRLVFAGF